MKSDNKKIFGNEILEKSLNELEGRIFNEPPDFDSYVVRKTYELLDKKLSQYTPEDLRLMIGQGFGLKYLVPLAIDLLKKDPLIEAKFYKGDLLKNVLKVEKGFWKNYPELEREILQLFKKGRINLNELETEEIKEAMIEAIEKFMG